MKQFFEKMFFAPKWYQYIIIGLLFPVSVIYGFSMLIRRVMVKKKSFDIPIISIGNLVVGGSGKTPFVIKIASSFDNAVVISRGYGRESKGLVEVSKQGQILVDVKTSGDEAMLMAKSLPNSSVIVSENREEAIEYAKSNGEKVILLDDGFNRVNIEKYEILLEPAKTVNYFPFPAGPFREFWFTKAFADIILKEGKDFKREVTYEPVNGRVMLLTAIANPLRLDAFLPKGIIKRVCLEDHAYFDEEKINSIVKKYNIDFIVTTSKDLVKLEHLNINAKIIEMKLSLTINDDIIHLIKTYIKERS